MAVRAFHPILYVADPYAEREFYERFGFTTIFEGDEFPGFLAVQCGPVVFGLSRERPVDTASHDGVRWQLIVDDVDEIVTICTQAGLQCEVITETGGDTHLARIAKVISPNGVFTWFEGPNELA